MTPRPKLVAGLALIALLLAGCSRLSFVKPDTRRGSAREIAPTYDIREDKQSRSRLQARDQLALAGNRLQSGQYDEAEKEARSALRLQPDSADAYTVLAIVADQRGDKRQAGTLYRRAAELAAGRGAEANNYGAWLCANGSMSESLAWFDRALADAGYATPASALANAGNCAYKIGQYERADGDLRRALDLEPANALALETMAANQYRLGRYFEARAFAERRLAAAPASPSMLQLAMQIEDRLGDKAAARRYLQRLQTEFPQAANVNSGAGT